MSGRSLPPMTPWDGGIGESQRRVIAEAVVQVLQRRQHDHGMGYMLELAGSYDARRFARDEA